LIEITQLLKTYNSRVIIDNLDLKIEKGGITSIIGPNGAGKSTLLMMISRLLKADNGLILLDGMDIKSTSSEILARRVSILRQENNIAARLTVHDLVAFGRYPYSKGRTTKEDKRKISQAIEYLDLNDLQDSFIDELSGGQRQRAFVAMVICQDTDYVLLDEPLNNFDMKNSVAMMKLLRRTATELKKTIVLVIHDINFASCYSDKLIAIRNGKIVSFGKPEEIMVPDVLKEIYDLDIKVTEFDGQKIAVYYS